MILVSQDAIDHYRSLLANDPRSTRALDMLEDCEGDLEDAAISLALQAGQEPDHSDDWLKGLAKRWRLLLCQDDVRQALEIGNVADGVAALVAEKEFPKVLAVLVVIYVLQMGLEPFCRPVQEQIR